MGKLYTTILSVFILFLFSVVSAHPFPDEEPLKVYPNPATDLVKVKLVADNPTEPVIKILDLTGKVVKDFKKPFTQSNDFYSAELDISDLNTGIYFVKIIQGESVYSEKLVVR